MLWEKYFGLMFDKEKLSSLQKRKRPGISSVKNNEDKKDPAFVTCGSIDVCFWSLFFGPRPTLRLISGGRWSIPYDLLCTPCKHYFSPHS
jgi:hypothetical protein